MFVRFCFSKASRSLRALVAIMALLTLLPLSGCHGLGLNSSDWFKLKNPFGKKNAARSQSPEKAEDDFDESGTKLKTPLVGDYTTFSGLHGVVLQGVGLVVGLNGTGGDPVPGGYREALLDDLKRREVRKPNELIASPDTAMVIVTAILPPLVGKGDHFDVEVRVEGESARSLNGGYLMETVLSETAVIGGTQQLKGHVVAKAKGPVLVSTGEGRQEDQAGLLRRGKVLGGARALIDRDMSVYLKSDFRNFRNVTRIADRIGQRFYSYNEHGTREPLSKAQTDQRINLKVHPRYKENDARYRQVIAHIAFRETPVEQRVRMQRLERELLIPEKSERAALQLEAIGSEGIPILKSGLKSPHLECRFHAAVALAYLEDSDGLDVLKEAALRERAFRVFSYAAMSALDDPRAHLVLRDLMSAQPVENKKEFDSSETRYGAFRALWTLDPNDPFIAGEHINDEFWLHPLRTTGGPIVHITHRKRNEIVLFGHDQEFITPLALRAGNHIMVTCRPGNDYITISRFAVGEKDQQIKTSRRIEEVLRACAKLGASYPDVAQLLVQADKQHNLPGRFEIDALPRAGRVYYRDAENKKETRIGRPAQAPSMFQQSEPETDEDDQSDKPESEDSGRASLVDARTTKTETKKSFWDKAWPWSQKNE